MREMMSGAVVHVENVVEVRDFFVDVLGFSFIEETYDDWSIDTRATVRRSYAEVHIEKTRQPLTGFEFVHFRVDDLDSFESWLRLNAPEDVEVGRNDSVLWCNITPTLQAEFEEMNQKSFEPVTPCR